MILLRYDTRHIRAFRREGDFLKPDSFFDELLPLAPGLFASSSSLRLNASLMQKLLQLSRLLKTPPVNLEVLRHSPLRLRLGEKEYALDLERTEFWRKVFAEDTGFHTAACRFGLPHQGKQHLEAFFAELGITLPPAILAVEEKGFFLPLEFLAGSVFCFHKKRGVPASGKWGSLHLLYDKNLLYAQEDAERVAYLIQKRGVRSDAQNPDILLVADHGHADGRLENFVLEEKVLAFKPRLTVVNSCSAAQGAFAHKMAGACILSPYETEADKSVFAPLLRFLQGLGNRDLFTAFTLACLFYPNMANYYRIYLPTNK